MSRTVEHNSFVPLYHQLKEILKEKIEYGDWMPGEKIPSENELRKQYDVSRNTAIKALDDLMKDGLLNRVQGRGTFVSKPKFEQPLSGFYSFSKVMKKKGMNPYDRIIHIERKQATPLEAKHLNIAENDEVIELRRLRCANDEPIMLETSHIPVTIMPSLTSEQIESSSLYDVMEKTYGVFVTSAREVFEPVLIRDYESHYLQEEKGYPALMLDRIAYNVDQQPVEFCRSIVRGDRCRFYTELL